METNKMQTKEEIIIKHREMALRLKKPGRDILRSLTPERCDFVHMGACLMGEAAEIYDALLAGEVENFVEECGDYEFYLAVEMNSHEVVRHGLCTPNLRSPIQHAVELMRLGGHYWDVIKRVVIYQKDPLASDKKYSGQTLRSVARGLLQEMESNLNSIYHLTRHSLEEVLEANYTKLADADTGRYASGKYSDEQAQNRRDENK